MLESDQITQVWCETYDDIVILRRTTEGETVEYIQAKNELPDQLWTLARLCSRDGSRCGTSLFERSLSRDQFKESASFRLVTSRDVASEINLLKLPREHRDRACSTEWFNEIENAIRNKLPNANYSDSKDCSYWLSRTLWQTYSDNELDCENKLSIQRLLEVLNFTVSSEMCAEVYQSLLSMVKVAAESRWCEREKRKIRRESLKSRLRDTADPFPTASYSERLALKMERAGLDETYIENAITLARRFRDFFRNSQYVAGFNRVALEATITKLIQDLRLDLDSGKINDTGIAFYARCVTAVSSLANSPCFASAGLGEDFFAGCMCEITRRCGHRFTKASQ
jgi:hypothetical protein